MLTASSDRLFESSGRCAHFLEFHRPGERRVGQSAGRFLAGALKDGGVAIAIADRRNAAGILTQLALMGDDPVRAMQTGQLEMNDSSEMLSRFMRHGVIDRDEFDRTAGAGIRAAVARAAGAPVRAFGDMVGLLWQREQRDTAVELERLWNCLQHDLGFGLLCSYPVDVFSPEFSNDELRRVLETHTHLFPSAGSAELGRVLDRAMDEVLGAISPDVRSRIVKRECGATPAMPKPEQMILWLRSDLPEFADDILERARALYEAGTQRVYLRQEHSSR